ncbi:Scarecrow-like transcription factor PAT1 [Linum grandiflorum]
MFAGGSGLLFNQPLQERESYCWFCIQNVPHYPCSEVDNNHLSATTFQQNCTLESSSGTGGSAAHNSPPATSFSTNESGVSQYNSHSYPSNNVHDSPDQSSGSPTSEFYVTHKLRELETAMLGPDSDILNDVIPPAGGNQMITEADKWKFLGEIISGGDLREGLCTCAQFLEDGDMYTVDWLIGELRRLVSVSGEPIQRLGAYAVEGIVARLASSGNAIYKGLRCKEPAPASMELLSYMHLLYEICPYFKFGYMSANGAIAEAMKDENRIHIIDFQIAQGTQWITLIQALAARPGGPPHIRITGIDDSTSAYARGGGLDIVGKRLTMLAQQCKVPFDFHSAGVPASEIQLENLKIQPGEAIAVNFALVLHHMPDESVGTQNHRDRLLRLVKGLSPKVVALVEQESNTNTAPFLARFVETLNYYSAIFESIDVALPREHKERINVEQHCLAREVVNIIACEGAERVERHELLGKWRSRFAMAGFKPYPLSSYVNATIRTLLGNYSTKYTLEEKDEALYLGWMDRHLVSSCAWR